MLRVQHLTKSYGAFRALNDLSFTLNAGEFCALLGPNGAGKSTLFQLLTGLFAPDQGDIEIEGRSLRGEPATVLSRIGVVFQQMALDPDLTALQNLAFHASLHGLTRTHWQARLPALSAGLGLEAHWSHPVKTLSGGTRRKIELVRAMLHSPPLLLLDEATVGLDVQSRHQIMAHVRSTVRETGCAVLWATHWTEECAHADRVLVLHRGQALADDRRDAVIAQLGGTDLESGFLKATAARGGPVLVSSN